MTQPQTTTPPWFSCSFCDRDPCPHPKIKARNGTCAQWTTPASRALVARLTAEMIEREQPQRNLMSETTLPDYSLFPNGTSHMIWRERNCDRCIKRYDEARHSKGLSHCDIENAIALASALDGTLTHCGQTPLNKAAAIAKRLNWDGLTYLQHDCPEFVP